ncbi:MAG: methyltransferase domain-containing protein [Elusimicrobiaceae bacterium]
MFLRPYISGLASYVPGSGVLHRILSRKKIGLASARYCYAVWLRHFVCAYNCGALARVPETVAELGPGRSLGAGLAALLSGAKRYYGLDIAKYSELSGNIEILDGLAELFAERSAIPSSEFPHLKPEMNDFSFPAFLKPDITPGRIGGIKSDILRGGGANLSYFVPWSGCDWRADMVFSQAVLEHVDDAAGAYREIYKRLNPGGVMTHQIDYRSHGTAPVWDGHRAYTLPQWRVIRGRKPYLINRLSHSSHIALIKEAGFRIILEIPVRSAPQAQNGYAPEFGNMSEADVGISGAFICAVK